MHVQNVMPLSTQLRIHTALITVSAPNFEDYKYFIIHTKIRGGN